MELSLFFYHNLICLCRFSQDLNLIDNELSLDMIDLVECRTPKPNLTHRRIADRASPDIYNNLYKLILIGIASAYIAPAFPLMLLAFWLIQRFYLRTSRQMRFLDLETKSPLYTHFIESLTGLATIRAFAWEDEFRQQNRVFLQASQRPFFLLMTIQRWLTMVLDFVVSILAVIVAIVAVEMRGKINSGFLGLALVNVVRIAQGCPNLQM